VNFCVEALPRQVLMLLFILVDTGQAFVMDWAEQRDCSSRPYARLTVLVFESALSIFIGLLAAWGFGGLAALRQCFNFKQFTKFLPLSICFTLGLSLKMRAINHVQAGTIKIFGQLRLPLLTIFSALLLGRTYSVVQWQVIAMITSSCVAFVVLKGQGRPVEGWKWSGLAELTGWVMLNVLGGIAAERAYKSRMLPFYAQKVCEDFGYLLISSVMLLLVVPYFDLGENVMDRKQRPGGFFDSWDIRTVAVVIFLLLDAFVGNLLLREFSAVSRSIAKAFCIATVYFVSQTYGKDRPTNHALNWVALLVIQSSLLFAFSS